MTTTAFELLPPDACNLRQYVDELKNHILKILINVLTKEPFGVGPADLARIDENLQQLIEKNS